MKNQFFIQFFIFGLLTIANGFFSQDSLAQTKNSYKCIQLNGKPTTIVDTARGRIQLIVWQSDFFRDSGWTPQKRCNEVTKRFQQFSDSGSLRYIATGTMNQQPVICVAEKNHQVLSVGETVYF